MFKIGDFSKLTQVSVRMLRYYDEQGLLKPSSVDSITGYRFYSASQIPRLHHIIALRDMGFLTAEIALMLNSSIGEETIREKLKRKIDQIQSAIELEKDKLKRLESFVESLETESEMRMEVVLKSIPAYKVIGLRDVIPNYSCEGVLWQRLGAFVGQNRIPSKELSFAIYHDREYRESDVDVEVVQCVDKLMEDRDGFCFREIEAVPVMAAIMVEGPYDRISGGFENLAKWIEDNNYQMIGASRQVCHKGPWSEKDPQRYLTEIQIPVEKKN